MNLKSENIHIRDRFCSHHQGMMYWINPVLHTYATTTTKVPTLEERHKQLQLETHQRLHVEVSEG
jgi:tmRNA-binding protein